MIIQGNHPFAGSIQDVWICLMDPEVLARIIPGISSLDHLGGDKYNATSSMKIGPVKGNFHGQLEIKDKVENKAATLVIDQKSKIGNVSAEIYMQLSKVEETTEIYYKGEAKLTGKIAMLGQRIIGAVINSYSGQFFKALKKEINP